MTLHAGHLQLALLRYLDWPSQVVVFEYEIDGGRADAVSISKARYLTEYEIKSSLADFRKDQAKDKWQATRPHISRFFYVVPATLVEKVSPLLAPGRGLLAVTWATLRRTEISRGTVGHLRTIGVRTVVAREVVAATRVRAQKISEADIARIYRDCYFRHWRAREQLLRSRINIEGLVRPFNWQAAFAADAEAGAA